MAQSQQHSAKAVLRLLLRAVDQHITSVSGNQQWRQHVLTQFRQAQNLDPTQQQRMLLLAQEYAELIRNIAHHQGLLDTYNIGLDPDSRNKQMVEKTAARVGFRLPGTDAAAAAAPTAAAPTAAAAAAGAGAGTNSSEQGCDTAASIPGQQQQQQQEAEPQLRQQQPMSSSTSLPGSGSLQASKQQHQQQQHVGPAVLAATA